MLNTNDGLKEESSQSDLDFLVDLDPEITQTFSKVSPLTVHIKDDSCSFSNTGQSSHSIFSNVSLVLVFRILPSWVIY